MAELQLIEAAKAGDVAKVRERLVAGDDVDEKLGSDTALLWAASLGHTEVVKLLIDCGANLSVTTSGGYSPLRLAESHPATAAVLRNAVQQPRSVPGKPERWVAAGESAVAFVSVLPGLQKKITQLFNFETRQHVLLSENLATRAEAMAAPTSFDDLPQRVLEKALEEFQGFGGTPDREYVLTGGEGLGKSRKMPAPGGNHG